MLLKESPCDIVEIQSHGDSKEMVVVRAWVGVDGARTVNLCCIVL